MGSLRKTLVKAGMLDPLSYGLERFVNMRKQSADQNQFNQFMNQAVNQIRKTYSEQPEEDISVLPKSKTRFGDLLKHPEETGGVIDNPEKPGINILDQPDDFILGDAKGRKYGTISEDEQRMKIQRIIAETLMKSGELGNLDPSKLQQGGNILELIGRSYTPKKVTKELKEYDPSKDLVEVDSDGNFKLVRPGMQDKKEKTIGSYVGKDGYHYTKLYDPASGEVKEIKSKNPVRPPKGTTIKIDYPEPEKWRNFGAVINMIDYKEDPETKEILETSPQEKKQLRKIAQNQALGNMLPGSVSFMRDRIWNAWQRENMSQTDFEAEILEGLDDGEISPEEAQDLIDYNQFRPFLYDELIETYKVNQNEEQ